MQMDGRTDGKGGRHMKCGEKRQKKDRWTTGQEESTKHHHLNDNDKNFKQIIRNDI
jgi:transcriptional regulator of NAD metabolism